MSTTQPEALRLAGALEELDQQFSYPGMCGEAAAELRRLSQSEREGWRYAKELESQLASIGAGGVSALMGAANAGSEPVAWLHVNRLGGVQAFTSEPPPSLKAQCQPLYTHPSPPEGMGAAKEQQAVAITDAMIEAGKKALHGHGERGARWKCVRVYEAMIAAAPPSSAQREREVSNG